MTEVVSTGIESSSWDWGWEALVAIFTIVLAGVTASLAGATAYLAKKTGHEVEAVKEEAAQAAAQVDLSRRALQASVRPLIVHELPGPAAGESTWGVARVRFDDNTWVLDQGVRNVGAGLALIRDASLTAPRGGVAVPALILTGALVPGQNVNVSARLRLAGQLEAALYTILENGGEAWLDLVYTDIENDQRTISRVVLQLDAGGVWTVKGTRLFRPGEPEPFAEVGFLETSHPDSQTFP